MHQRKKLQRRGGVGGLKPQVKKTTEMAVALTTITRVRSFFAMDVIDMSA
jgi:hypothetical protein